MVTLSNLPKCLKREISSFDYELGDESLNATWKPKTEYPVETQKQAASALKDMACGMGSVEKETLVRWLSVLGTLCAGKDSLGDSKAKTAAYTYMLSEYPAFVFTKQTLDEVCRKNKWMTYTDVCEVLDTKIRERESIANRLKIISECKPLLENEPIPATDEQKEEVSRIVNEYINGKKV